MLRINGQTLAIGVLFLLLPLVFWLYAQALPGYLNLDDYPNLTPLKNFENGAITLKEAITRNESGHFNRPVPMVSFALDVILHGFDISALRTTNIAIHLLCGCLIFWLSGLLLPYFTKSSTHHWLWAAWVAALWLLSPLLVSTTLYIVQRMAQLAALFTFLGLIFYVRLRQRTIDPGHRLSAGDYLCLAGMVFSGLLATLSKENGALLFLLAMVIEISCFQFRGHAATRRLIKTGFAITVILPFVAAAVWVMMHPGLVLDGYQYRSFSLSERLLTQPRVLVDYLQQLITPRGGRMGLYQDDFAISRSLVQPLSTVITLVGWLAVAVLIFRWRHDATVRAMGFGLLFFVAAHLLESTVFPLEIYFEHRNYLPAFGIYFMLTCIIWRLLQPDLAKLRVLAGLFVVLLPLLFVAVTSRQVKVWASSEATFERAFTYHPQSLRLRQELSLGFLREGMTDQAREQIKAVAEIDPNQVASMGLLELLMMCNKDEIPEPHLKQDIYDRLSYFSLQISSAVLLEQLANFYEVRDCRGFPIAETATHLGKITRAYSPQGKRQIQYQYHIALGRIFMNAKHYPSALTQLQQADQLYPRKLEAGLLMLRCLYEAGNKLAARNLYDQLVARVHEDSDSYLYQRFSLKAYAGIIQSMPE